MARFPSRSDTLAEMRVLAMADRKPDRPVIELIELAKPDLIVTLGDLGTYELAGLQNCSLPKIGVYGNHCVPGYFERLGISNLHLNIIEFGGLRFGGVEGCPRYKQGPFQYEQGEMWELLAAMPAVDVLCTHAPPELVNDHADEAHRGWAALPSYLERTRPRYLLHGHTSPRPEECVSYLPSSDTAVHWVLGAQLLVL